MVKEKMGNEEERLRTVLKLLKLNKKNEIKVKASTKILKEGWRKITIEIFIPSSQLS